MGRFIISRTACGVRFLLQSEAGRTLCVSKDYATLDACKKTIRCLRRLSCSAPIRNAAAGERGPNPKFELIGGNGAFSFSLKSENGKTVLTVGPYATMKACLRALSVVRNEAEKSTVCLSRPGGLLPLIPGDGTPARVQKKMPDYHVGCEETTADDADFGEVQDVESRQPSAAAPDSEGKMPDEPCLPAESGIATDGEKTVTAKPVGVTPRVVRLQTKKTEPAQIRKKNIFERFFGK